jgi:hypothetical protein
MKMTPDQNGAQKSAAPNGPRDLISRLYREIGISAVAAALEATSRKPQKPLPSRKDMPAVLRGEEAA